MKAIVTQGIRVVHDGKVYQDGQRGNVAERVAREWITYGWASERGAQSLPDARGLAGHPATVDDAPAVEPDAEPEPVGDQSDQKPSKPKARRDPRKGGNSEQC